MVDQGRVDADYLQSRDIADVLGTDHAGRTSVRFAENVEGKNLMAEGGEAPLCDNREQFAKLDHRADLELPPRSWGASSRD
ncbi:hypothetical protein YH62_02155 [Rhizobium sp. LC145]|nr:hypothetical protein YH62_02155 [Rhizobium sp. LC145]